jgi:Transposase
MKPAGTSRPLNSRPPITVRMPPSPRPATQQPESPDSPGRFNHGESVTLHPLRLSGHQPRYQETYVTRLLVPLSNAIVGIDLADVKQAAVVTDHDSRVIARRRVSARAWELGELLDWAVARASAAGFASVTVACEPTGHRWRVLDQLAAGRGLALVCVQPLLVYRAREGEDLTRDKSDPMDAVLIARLASELRCYEPEHAGAVWARLRHLGARRNQVTTGATAAVNQIRDLLECAWPAALAASPSPFRSMTWHAALAVVLDRCAGDPARVRRGGLDRFTAAVRRELPGGAEPGHACGSSGRCSLRWPIPPGSPRTAPARWNAHTWRWATGGIPAPGSPTPKPGWARPWMISG